MSKKLSRTGRTSFTIENIDWPFIMEALEYYQKYVNATEFPEHSFIAKPFVQARVESLLQTFRVEFENQREERDKELMGELPDKESKGGSNIHGYRVG